MQVRTIKMGRPSGNLGESPYPRLAKALNQKQCHFLEGGWLAKSVPSLKILRRRRLRELPVTVYHPPGDKAGCSPSGSPSYLGNETSGTESGQDQGTSELQEQVAQTPRHLPRVAQSPSSTGIPAVCGGRCVI